MGKLNIKDLEYLVLEGGGAKGVVYLGAIEALEEQLEAAYKNGDVKKRVVIIEDDVAVTRILNIEEEKLANLFYVDRFNYKNKRSETCSILDYYSKDFSSFDNKVYPPRIKGIAGSSAGAITSFALTLGLNSADITKVMKYSFTNFLSEKDIGKYRMVNSKNEIKVGQDDKKILGGVEEDFKFQNSKYFDAKSNLKKQWQDNSLLVESLRQLLMEHLTKSKPLFKWVLKEDSETWWTIGLGGPSLLKFKIIRTPKDLGSIKL